MQGWLQVVNSISGSYDFEKSSGMITNKYVSVSREAYEAKYVDPLTGEESSYEYMIIRYTGYRIVNGEFQVYHSWEIQK